MFGKNKSYKDINSDLVKTIIGEQCEFYGDILSHSSLKIDGKLKGNSKVEGNIIIGEKGQIEGDIHCRDLIIFGSFNGNIYCSNLILKDSSVINANIETIKLEIDDGAVYNGNIKMLNSPELLENISLPLEKIE